MKLNQHSQQRLLSNLHDKMKIGKKLQKTEETGDSHSLRILAQTIFLD
jgi:hypothetical protein